MNYNLSSISEHLIQTILDSNGERPDLLNLFDSKYLRELNEAYPSLLSYKIKRQFGLLRLYDPTLENKLHLLEVKELEERLNMLSQETRYAQLKRLREANGNPEHKFIYGDIPCESDDVISYMKGMSAEEIYERRKRVVVIYNKLEERFGNNYNHKLCPIFNVKQIYENE